MALEPRQKRFCEEYIIDLNATQAAIRAGYSPRTARVQSSALLIKPDIKAEIDRLKLARSERTDITAERVLKETYLLAMSDIGEAFNADGSLKPVKDIPAHIRRAIAGIEVEELFEGVGKDREQIGYTRKLKLWDKVKTLELLGKHLKLFTDKVEHSGNINIEGLISGSGPAVE